MSTLAKPKAAVPVALEVKWQRVGENDADTARLLRELKTEMGRARWLAEGRRRFGWTETVMDRRANPVSVQRKRVGDRERAAETRRVGVSDWYDAPPPPRVSTTTEREKHASLVVEMIREGYKALAKKHHPDVGGSGEHMALLSAARDWGVNFIENPPLINYGR